MIKIQNNSQRKTDWQEHTKEVTEPHSQFKAATMMLCEAMLQFFYGIDKSLSEKLQSHNLQVLSQLGQIETRQQQMAYRLDALAGKLNDFGSLKNLLEQECQSKRILTKQHYENHIIQPMVRTLAPIADMVDDAQKTLDSGPDGTADKVSELVNAVYTQLKQFLNSYGVESIKHRPNARFNPRLMKPVKIVPTTDRNLDGCVAESLLTGLILGQDRLVRPESVSLYRYEAVHETEMLTLNERMENNVDTRI